MAAAFRGDSRRAADVRSRLGTIAAARKSALLTLAKSDPDSALQLMLDSATLKTLGPLSNGLLEQKVQTAGWYTVWHRDAPSGDIFTPELITSTGTLDVLGADPILGHLKLGPNQTVSGYQLDNTVIAMAAGSTSTGSGTTSGSATPLGPLNVAVILGNFSNSTTSLDPAVPQNAFQGSPGADVDSWYAENSYGQSSLNPSFLGPYTIPDTTASGACPNLNTAGSDLMNAASPYVTYSQFQRIILIFNCTGYGASTNVGQSLIATPQGNITGGLTYMDSTYLGDKYGFAHELAHNLGDYHAAYYSCNPSSFISPTRFGQGCLSAEYGDEFDVLGATITSPRATPHLDPYHKYNAGWFAPSNYVTLNTPGTYTYKLLPYETPTNGVLALNIPRGSSGTAFTLEYRQPTGFDSWMAPSNTTYCSGQCTVTEGPSIELVDKQAGNGGGSDTQAIDTTPNSIQSGNYFPITDNRDGALLPGKTFTDPEYGISITTQSADSTGTTVQVTVPAAATCTRQAPTVSLVSPSSQTASPGQALTYTVSVTDNSSSSCPAEEYKYLGGRLQAAVASGVFGNFTAVANPDVFTLSPGATTNVSVTLTPDPTVVDGAYSFGVNMGGGIGRLVADDLDIPITSMPNVTFQITSPADSTPPSPPANLAAQVLGSGAVNLTWSPSTDNVGVVGYEVLVDNSSSYYTTNASSFTIFNGVTAGTVHTFSVQAFDQQNNLSAASSTSATTPPVTDTTAPTVPGGLTATATDRSVTLSWQPSTDTGTVIGYVVSPFNAWEPAGTTSATFSNLATNTTYNMSVQAVDAAGNETYAGSNGIAVTTAHAGTVAPTQPQQLYSPSATVNAGVQLSWTASADPAGVSGYYVYRNGRLWTTVSTTSYVDPPADLYAPGAGYQYYVQAFDAAGNVSPPTPVLQVVSPVLGSADTSPPSGASLTNPASNSTVAGTVNLTASPTDNVGVSKVEFYLDGTIIGQSYGAPYTFAWDTTTTFDGSHYLYVRAYDSAGNYSTAGFTPLTVANGTPDTAPPTTPGTLTGAAASSTQVNLSWGASSDNDLAGYRIYRNNSQVATVTGTSWSDTGVVGSTTYSYYVVAYDAAGNASAPSNTVSVATPDTAPPTTPGTLTGAAASSTQVNLSWGASSDNDLAGYRIYRNNSQVATVTGTSWSDTGVVGSTTYSYYVVAYDAAGNASAPSNTVGVTTPSSGGSSGGLNQNTGTIAGTVTSKATGQPLGGVKVSVTVNGKKIGCTSSTSGSYALQQIAPGSYQVTFTLKGYKTQTLTVSVSGGQTTTLNVAM